jgi:2Fe-2S ferredoxin
MPIISFKKQRPSIHTFSGSNLMTALVAEGIPVASSCGGDGVCGKCKIQIVDGNENLSKENETELILRERLNLDSLESLEKKYRFSCQCVLLGDIVIDATYW